MPLKRIPTQHVVGERIQVYFKSIVLHVIQIYSADKIFGKFFNFIRAASAHLCPNQHPRMGSVMLLKWLVVSDASEPSLQIQPAPDCRVFNNWIQVQIQMCRLQVISSQLQKELGLRAKRRKSWADTSRGRKHANRETGVWKRRVRWRLTKE